ncbi:MAG: type VI secretion system ATPase TssH [Alphaproteobacteria bacterium]
MSSIQSLIEKLNQTCRRAMEEGAQICVSQTHFTVDIEHILLKLCEKKTTDLQVVFRAYDIDEKSVATQLKQALDQFKRGNNKTPSLSPQITKLLERAWVISSLTLKQPQIRSAALLIALLQTEELLGIVMNSCPALLKIPRNQLMEDIHELIKNSPEEVVGDETHHPKRSHESSTESLDRFTVDLTRQAQEGKIDPIEGREEEIRQIIDILTRRRQNNPILTGDAGVGKTAVVEGLALRVIKGDVPPALKNVRILSLDLGLLEAGAGVKGEFENRLKGVITEVQASLQPIILFIDEAHTLIGGEGANQNDAANLLKPALARGELRTIAATTWDEYKKYFEKDAALTRRFQVVKVEEPSPEKAVHMLRSLVYKLEEHHKVLILDTAVMEAVKLSSRYITGRKLPDKAVSVLDTACARVAVGQSSIPGEIEDMQTHISLLNHEKSRLEKEVRNGYQHDARLDEIKEELETSEKKLKTLDHQWKEELDLVKQVLELQRTLQDQEGTNASAHKKLEALKKELESKQKDNPLVPLCVDGHVVAQVIASWTGIPLGKMMRNEIDTLLNLKEKMAEKIIGQKEALETVSKHIVTYRAHLDDPNKPVGVFLLVGPSGVGKTETALALADTLYGGDKNLITINMSEYQEAHTVSLLKGSPPGYIGHGKGGVLTEAVRRNPYSVVLLDEIEKAHPDVMELFYQVFDKGIMEDAEGIEINFRNTILLMTSNLASDLIMESCDGKHPDFEKLHQLIRPALIQHFKPALLGRMVVVPYYPLTSAETQKIIHLKLNKIKKRFEGHHKAQFTYGDDVIDLIAEKCTDPETGARNIDFILNQHVLPVLSAKILEKISTQELFENVKIGVKDGAFCCAFGKKI